MGAVLWQMLALPGSGLAAECCALSESLKIGRIATGTASVTRVWIGLILVAYLTCLSHPHCTVAHRARASTGPARVASTCFHSVLLWHNTHHRKCTSSLFLSCCPSRRAVLKYRDNSVAGSTFSVTITMSTCRTFSLFREAALFASQFSPCPHFDCSHGVHLPPDC